MVGGMARDAERPFHAETGEQAQRLQRRVDGEGAQGWHCIRSGGGDEDCRIEWSTRGQGADGRDGEEGEREQEPHRVSGRYSAR